MAVTSGEARRKVDEEAETPGIGEALAEADTDMAHALRLAVLEDPLLAHTALSVLLLAQYDDAREKMATAQQNMELASLALKRLGVHPEDDTATAEQEPVRLLTLRELKSVDRWYYMATRVRGYLLTRQSTLEDMRQHLARTEPGSAEAKGLAATLARLEIYDGIVVGGLVSHQAVKRLVGAGRHVDRYTSERVSAVLKEIAEAHFGPPS